MNLAITRWLANSRNAWIRFVAFHASSNDIRGKGGICQAAEGSRVVDFKVCQGHRFQDVVVRKGFRECFHIRCIERPWRKPGFARLFLMKT